MNTQAEYYEYTQQWKAVLAMMVFSARLRGLNDEAWHIIDSSPVVQVNACNGTLYLAKTGYPKLNVPRTFLY